MDFALNTPFAAMISAVALYHFGRTKVPNERPCSSSRLHVRFAVRSNRKVGMRCMA